MGKHIERGQTITFRIPSDTPEYLLKQLQQLKDTERRNFSSKIASFVLKGVNETAVKERETVTIPLPKPLTKEQKSWLKHEHSEALIGTILYQLLTDPMRATALLTSMNQRADNAAQYLETYQKPSYQQETAATEEEWNIDHLAADELDIHSSSVGEEQDEEEDPLGDFFSSMNK